MKKLSALLLVLLLCLSLTACIAKDVRGDVSGNHTDDSTPVLSEEETTKFSMGETTNNSYKNEFANIGCNLPNNWVFYTDEQIKELNNFTKDAIGDELAEAIENASIIYDMYAQADDGVLNTNINLEKLTVLQAATINIEETLRGQFDSMRTAFENMGYTNVNVEYTKTTVDGKALDGAKITAQINGINFYSLAICYKAKNYLVNISLGSLGEDKTDEILNYFYFIK